MQDRPTATLRAAAILVFALAAAGPHARAAEPSAPWPTAGWESSTPEEQGMSPAALADLVDYGTTNAMDSMLVIRHGKIVLEAYYAPFKPGLKHLVNSVTKGVVGTLAGIAFKEGKIERLDAPVLGFFPEREVANLDAQKKAMSLQNLLELTSGLSWREPLSSEVPETLLQLERSDDWVGFVLDRPMAQPPGVSFDYDSGTWHLVSAILARQTGSDTLEYARRKLFAPLGISDVAWRRDPQGIAIGGFGLFMQPRDMAKIGYLYLRGGQWAGQQLLPPQWVDTVLHPSVDMHLGKAGAFRYGNGWWSIPARHATLAVGFLCQLVVVLPEIDTVAVVTGRRSYPLEALIDRIVAAARSQAALAADATASARLADRVAAAAVEKASPVAPVPTLAATISSKTYRFLANRQGLHSMKLELVGASPHYEIEVEAAIEGAPMRRVEGPIGLDGLFRLGEQRQGTDPLLAVKGSWLGDSVFQVVARSLLEGVVTSYRLTFQGKSVEVALEDNRGVRARLQGEASE
ncbi:MAG: serine hydrolase domain-containing protein [Caldimonas sp.]